MSEQSDWLSLSEAAAVLGVHFTTLRRWSDRGLVETVRTPGGRRKYERRALLEFLDGHRVPVRQDNALALLADSAVSKTRQQLAAGSMQSQPWYHQMDEQQRLTLRSSGSRLIALMFQYCARDTDASIFLQQATAIAEEYGQFCYTSGLSLNDCIQTFLSFRRPMLSAIHETGSAHGMGDVDSARLFEKLNLFMDALLLAMVRNFTAQAPQSPLQIR